MDRPDIRILVGQGGSGKSTLARSWLTDAPRVLIHDFNGEVESAVGAHVVTDRRQLVELLILARPIRVCWRPYVASTGEEMTLDLFEWANRCAWAAGDLWVVWEEVDLLTATRCRLPGRAYQLVNQGRHRDIRIVACSRRPPLVPIGLRASATRVVAFRTTEPDDVDYLRKKIGEAARELPGLADREYVDWRDGVVARCRA